MLMPGNEPTSTGAANPTGGRLFERRRKLRIQLPAQEGVYTALQPPVASVFSDPCNWQMLEAREIEVEHDASGKEGYPRRRVHKALEDRGSPRTRRAARIRKAGEARLICSVTYTAPQAFGCPYGGRSL